MGNGPVDEGGSDLPPADGDTPGSVLRTLVARGVGGDSTSLDGSIDVVERGDDPEPAARLPALVAGGASIVGVVPRIEPSLARRIVGGEGIEGPGGAATEGSKETATEETGGVDAEFRLVFTGSAGDRLTGPSGAAIRTILANRGIETYVHEGDSPVGILLIDDRAAVGLFDDGGLAALLWSDAPAVRTWAAATCRRYFAAANRA